MTKISGFSEVDSVENGKLQAEQKQIDSKEAIKDRSFAKDDSVIADLTPELSSPEQAQSLILGLTSQLESDPDRAIAAQGVLDEERITELLKDD